MLTEEKVAQGFKAAGERMNTLETSQAELRQAMDQLAKSIRLQTKAFLTGRTESGESYNRFWPTEEYAKQFGELVFRVINNKAMGEGTLTGGGALVPDELSSIIVQKLGVFGKFRRNVTIVPIGSGQQTFPKVQSDLTIYCPGEGKEITPSDIDFSLLKLVPKAWCALAILSSELDEDAIVGIGEIIGTSMVRIMTKKEDEVGFIGDGTSTYFGMTGICQALLNVDAVIANIQGLVVAAGNAYGEITLGNFREVIGTLPDDCDETAKWYMHKKFYHNVVYPLAETAGVANLFEILSDRKERYLFGYPIEFVHSMPWEEANSQICVLLGDLRMGAYLGERKQITIEQSPHVLFTQNQIAVRGVERIDINAFGVGDTTDPGPIVGLITAAA